MSKEYLAKAFKSGNSVALRLPKALGVTEGEELKIISHADGGFTIIKTSEALEAFMSLAGRLSPDFMAVGRGDIEQPERDWRSEGDPARAA
ncbi:hypothetical protein JW805_09390 [Roseomonas aeriglobus]|nr:hypothetical protein [Roseomonas aeriglobus]